MRKVLLAVSLAPIILGACSNSSGGLEKTEAALVQLDEAWQSYLNDPYPPYPETLDEEGLRQAEIFFREGERRIEDLERLLLSLTIAAAEEGAGGMKFNQGNSFTLDEYLELFDVWVQAQREQVDESRFCALESTEPPACVIEMFEENGGRWQATADALNAELQRAGLLK